MNMNRALLASVAGHVVVVAVSYFGLPMLRDPLPIIDRPMVVEVVTVADQTNAPPPAPEPPKKAEAEPKPEPPKPEPEPEPPKPEPPPPPPPPEPEPAPPPPEPEPPPPEPEPPPPEPEPEPVPEPVPAPEAEVKPEPKPEPKPAPKPQAPQQLAMAQPKAKPKPPDSFSSVLRTVEDLKKQRPREPEPEKKPEEKKEPSFEEQIAAVLSQRPQQQAPHDPTAPLTISEIDLVRQQIARCWNVPIGAKDAEDLNIEIAVEMNPDGTVRSADIVDKMRLSDPFFRAAAESALRAVNNPRCSPFRLPQEKYESWKTMTLNFNPKELLGT